MNKQKLVRAFAIVAFASFLAAVAGIEAATVANPLCMDNTALFDPGSGQNIVLPAGFTVSVFAKGLNMPTGIAFRGTAQHFQVYVLESGPGLPSGCNEQGSFGTGDFDPSNPLTPDILVFDQHGTQIAGPLGKPTGSGGLQTGGLQAAGPAVDIAFERGFQGGRLFATDSNQANHAAGQKNNSRIVTADPKTGKGTPFIT